ncbi:hypothetical protein DLAC_11573 [Tieghemostelium lacteum]|uniref:Uncharacterized protein n=1 Tax=Tieghemostelium lacteum TaxID=361077 RepID=A0A151ZS83_TIELA|nr:hypothetical protein DLAC_11573 [Tieghemostelium lacteum]|eukprot:KYQ96779.1 hypothetical protein DLAC_11573 [Tieghemostelium lacteum]
MLISKCLQRQIFQNIQKQHINSILNLGCNVLVNGNTFKNSILQDSRIGVSMLMDTKRYYSNKHKKSQQQATQEQINAAAKIDPRFNNYNQKFQNDLVNVKLRKEQIIEEIEKGIKNETLQKEKPDSANPFNLLFIKRGGLASLLYYPSKLQSLFKSYKPLEKSKLTQIMKDNFFQLYSALENNDIDTLSKLKFDESHFIFETCRDLFHTFRTHSIKYQFKYDSVEPVIAKFVVNLPYFDALVFYYIDAEVTLPDGTKKKEKYVSTILWRGQFPESNEPSKSTEQNEKEQLPQSNKQKVDFVKNITWRVGELFISNELSYIHDLRVYNRYVEYQKSNKNDK